MSLGRLPTEMLFQIADWLPIPDLRVLGRVNRQFAGIVDRYCKVYQYKLGLFRLPESVLQQIMGHLGTVDEQSRLARTSQKLYPVVMTSLVSSAHADDKSNMLNYAVMCNNVSMAQKILQLGGDINRPGQWGWCLWPPTPLQNAIIKEHEDIVRFLLHAGASTIDKFGCQRCLMDTLAQGQDEMSLILCDELSESDELYPCGPSVLSEACCHGRVVVAESLLRRGDQAKSRREQSMRSRSQALHSLLNSNAWKGSLLVDDKLVVKALDEVYKITSLLLEYGANPDIDFHYWGPRDRDWVLRDRITKSSSRKWGKRSPDPRIRALFNLESTDSTVKSKNHRRRR